MSSLHAYLSAARSNIAKTEFVIVGNDAADLDSVVSAIAYAYLRYLQDETLHVLSLIAISRADFRLRTEVVYVLKQAGIHLDDLVFMDEIDLAEIFTSGADLILVDHNYPSSQFLPYHDRVVGVLDHHYDEGFFPDILPRLIQEVGSTASLVTQEFFQAGIYMGQEVATMLCGAILLDTVNLDPATMRVTSVDSSAIGQMESLYPLSKTELYTAILTEKNKITDLSTCDLLSRDYKSFQVCGRHCGIGVVPIPMAAWIRHDLDCYSGFMNYMDSKKLDLLVIMSAFTDGKFKRELVMVCSFPQILDRLFATLQSKGLDLTLQDSFPAGTGDTTKVRVYSQGDLMGSRKIIQPILVRFFSGKARLELHN